MKFFIKNYISNLSALKLNSIHYSYNFKDNCKSGVVVGNLPRQSNLLKLSFLLSQIFTLLLFIIIQICYYESLSLTHLYQYNQELNLNLLQWYLIIDVCI